MNISPEITTISKQEIPPRGIDKDAVILWAGEGFLGEHADMISPDVFDAAVAHAIERYETVLEHFENPTAENIRTVSYDKYKSSFKVGNEAKVSMGNIVAARHLGISLSLPKLLESSGEGKRARKLASEFMVRDTLCEELNGELARALAADTKRKDLFKSQAYEKIAERSGKDSEQLGVIAERIMMNVLEALMIDRPDLGFMVSPANAYQDVEEKIDFIIATKQKKRGVGVETEDVVSEQKHIGVQFTINTQKKEHKLDQIAKAKERGVDVDDIVYVAIDQGTLRKAIGTWEHEGKALVGPWKYLPLETRRATLKELFKGILSPEQEASLLKSLE